MYGNADKSGHLSGSWFTNSSRVLPTSRVIYQLLYNNQINARALIGQSAVGYCADKPTENRASSELLYKSNRPQVFYGLYMNVVPRSTMNTNGGTENQL